MIRAGTLIAFASLVAACSSAPPQRVAETQMPVTRLPTDSLHVGRVVTDHALAMIGVPYRYGGDHPETGFDCSGLVYYSYSMSGLTVPRTSQAQFRAARKIALANVARGDIMFFQDQEKLSHVGIYVGEGMFVHAPSSGRAVSLASIDSPYYQRNLVAVGRLLPN
jgi:cell wall-associated NlpC family hydrolase